MEKQQVVILGDFDNFSCAISEDPMILNPQNRMDAMGRIVASELIRLAKTFGELECAKNLIGVLALPSAHSGNTGIKNLSRASFRKQALEFACGLIDTGFKITLISQGYNASDHELEKKVFKDIRKQSFVSTVIIVTGDGKEPFCSMIKALNEKGKNVQVVIYDKVPHALKHKLVPCEYLRLAPIIHQRAHEMLEDSKTSEMLKTSVASTPIKSSARSPVHIYLNALYAIQNKSQYTGEAFYLERAQAGLEALADTRASKELLRVPVGGVITYLGKYLNKEKNMNLEWSDVEPLAYALIRADRIRLESVYTLPSRAEPKV